MSLCFRLTCSSEFAACSEFRICTISSIIKFAISWECSCLNFNIVCVGIESGLFWQMKFLDCILLDHKKLLKILHIYWNDIQSIRWSLEIMWSFLLQFLKFHAAVNVNVKSWINEFRTKELTLTVESRDLSLSLFPISSYIILRDFKMTINISM